MTLVRGCCLVTLAIAGCSSLSAPPPPSTILISDYGANAILAYDALTGAFRDVFAAGSAARVDRPASVRLGPDGALYAAGFGRGEVVRYDAASGAMTDVFYRDTTVLEEPVELAFRGDELLVLGNDTANAVLVDASGRMTRELGYPLMRGAHDFVLDGDRMFVAADSNAELRPGGAAIQEWDVATGTLVRAYGGRELLASATGLAVADGIVYACDYQLDRIVRFDAETGASLGVLAEGARLESPVSLEVGPDGTLAVLAHDGVQSLDADSGAYLGTLIPRDEHWRYPRSFTVVPDAALQ